MLLGRHGLDFLLAKVGRLGDGSGDSSSPSRLSREESEDRDEMEEMDDGLRRPWILEAMLAPR